MTASKWVVFILSLLGIWLGYEVREDPQLALEAHACNSSIHGGKIEAIRLARVTWKWVWWWHLLDQHLGGRGWQVSWDFQDSQELLLHRDNPVLKNIMKSKVFHFSLSMFNDRKPNYCLGSSAILWDLKVARNLMSGLGWWKHLMGKPSDPCSSPRAHVRKLDAGCASAILAGLPSIFLPTCSYRDIF